MPTIFNHKGYTASDPLDKASSFGRFLIMAIVNFVLTGILIYTILSNGVLYFNGFHLFGIYFGSGWTIVLEFIMNVIIFTTIIIPLRKSSSIVPFLIVFVPYYLLDIYLESSLRFYDKEALWMYIDTSFVSLINPAALRFFVTLSVDALLFGPLALFFSRVIASVVYKKIELKEPTLSEQKNLFSDKWTLDSVDKPKHDAGFWIFRLLGIAYLSYGCLLTILKLAVNIMPENLQFLSTMTYQNPAMAINTFCKIGIMMILAFLGAYNRNIRWHCALVILIAHIISTAGSLAFYFAANNNDPFKNFLMTSAIADGGIIILCLIVMLKFYQKDEQFSCDKNYPDYFSTPSSLLRIVFYFTGVLSVLQFITVLVFRTHIINSDFLSLSIVYGKPDPTICNTLTLYAAQATLSFLMTKRERIRDYFLGVQLFAYITTVAITIPWLIIGTGGILVSKDNYHTAYPYYILNVLICSLLAVLLISLRKMYFNVEFTISSINPSSARNIMAFFRSIFPDSPEGQSAVLKRIDEFVSDVKGRKRGLMNLPYWAVEHVLGLLFGLRPPFSWMSNDERRYFLWKYILRRPADRMESFIPFISNIAHQVGFGSHALVNMSNYAGIKQQKKIGYVPPDARDRLQGDFAAYPPPFKNPAPDPKDELDPNNFKPVNNAVINTRLIAPKVVTPIDEYNLNENQDFDYVIIGSGAGGATMAYRLVCEKSDPEKILVIEQGPRLSPLQDFNDNDMAMLPKVYKDGGLQITKKYDMIVLQGVCVGGSTVINNSICFEIPPAVRTSWENNYGLNLTGLDAEYLTLSRELNVGPLNINGSNQLVRDKFKLGIEEYNKTGPHSPLSWQDAPVNASNPFGDGFWNSGNKRMRKRSMLETYIPWAEARGVKVVSNTTAVSFEHSGKGSNKRADWIIVRSNTGTLRKIKINKALVVAAGGIASSHFLMRSGVTENVGQNMSSNFAFPFATRFEEKLKAYDGEQISMCALDPLGRAVFETHFIPPASFGPELPFYFNHLTNYMNQYSHLVNFGILVGSEPNGKIEKKENILTGKAFTWEFGQQDIANLKYAFTTLLNIIMNAGAQEVVIPTLPGIKMTPNKANVVNFEKFIESYPLRMSDLFVNTAHPQGGNRMSKFSDNKRVVDENFKVVGFENVFVADASVFPTGITVNPQYTIMAMSSLAAKEVFKVSSQKK